MAFFRAVRLVVDVRLGSKPSRVRPWQAQRGLHSGVAKVFNQPKSGNEMPRSGGIATMMRLPLQEGNTEGLDACFVGIPMDHGCSNHSGTRLGPRAIRQGSMLLRPINFTGASPFESLNVGEIGDVPINTFNLHKTLEIITNFYKKILKANCIPLTMGGDHTLTLPILRAFKERHGPVGLIQVDAHTDLHDTMFGEKIAHGTPFRRALEEGLISPKHMVQIGLRGGIYNPEEIQNVFEWAQNLGVRMVFADQCWHKSMSPLMESVQEQMGNIPVYLTFDIDGIDLTACPGTGTPEVGGLTPVQAIEIIRGCRGLNLVGADCVEGMSRGNSRPLLPSVRHCEFIYQRWEQKRAGNSTQPRLAIVNWCHRDLAVAERVPKFCEYKQNDVRYKREERG